MNQLTFKDSYLAEIDGRGGHRAISQMKEPPKRSVSTKKTFRMLFKSTDMKAILGDTPMPEMENSSNHSRVKHRS